MDSINAYIEASIKKNWNTLALSDLGGINYRYKDVARKIEKLHILFEAADLKPGDKVAICGKNSSNWAIAFLSCLTAGVVAVKLNCSSLILQYGKTLMSHQCQK